jgi:hypothetical protein
MALPNGGVIDKPVKVNQTERYTFGLANWLNGEALTGATLTGDSLATLSPVDISGPVIGFFATGVTKGVSVVHVDYTTATRSDCATLRIVILSDCK